MPIRECRCQDIDQVLLHEITFSVQVLGNNASIRSKLAGLGKKREESVKITYFMSKATAVPLANHSQCSSPVEALNLIAKSKSMPVELNDSTIRSHVPSR